MEEHFEKWIRWARTFFWRLLNVSSKQLHYHQLTLPSPWRDGQPLPCINVDVDVPPCMYLMLMKALYIPIRYCRVNEIHKEQAKPYLA